MITSFTTGPGATTLPILIWSKVKLGVTPDINALATLIVVVVGIGVAIAGVILHRVEKRRERDIQARDRRQRPMIAAETPRTPASAPTSRPRPASPAPAASATPPRCTSTTAASSRPRPSRSTASSP